MGVALALVIALTPVSSFSSRHFLWRVNKERQAASQPYLARDVTLDAVAARECDRMLATGRVSDDSSGVVSRLAALAYRYARLGIISGWTNAPDPQPWLLSAFMASREHAAIIVGRWQRFGGAICGNGATYVTVLFVAR